MTAILAQRTDLPYSHARVEEHGPGSRKRHDFVLYRRGSNRAALTGEVKMPDSPQGRSSQDSELVEDAFQKANREGVSYYFTWNVRELALFKRDEREVPYAERIIDEPRRVAEVYVSDDLRAPGIAEEIKEFWERFLVY